jgi:hypothetical protein
MIIDKELDELKAKLKRMRAVGITSKMAQDPEIAILLAALEIFSGEMEEKNNE